MRVKELFMLMQQQKILLYVICLYHTFQAIKCFSLCVITCISKQPSERSKIIPIVQIETEAQRSSGFPKIIQPGSGFGAFFPPVLTSFFHTSCFLMIKSVVFLGFRIIYTLVLSPFANGVIASQNSSGDGLETAFL